MVLHFPSAQWSEISTENYFPDHIAGLVLPFTNICYGHPLGTICCVGCAVEKALCLKALYHLSPLAHKQILPTYTDYPTGILSVGVTELSSCRTNTTLTGPHYHSATADVPTENECSLLKQNPCMQLLPSENSRSRCKWKAMCGSSRDTISTLTKWTELIKGRSNNLFPSPSTTEVNLPSIAWPLNILTFSQILLSLSRFYINAWGKRPVIWRLVRTPKRIHTYIFSLVLRMEWRLFAHC